MRSSLLISALLLPTASPFSPIVRSPLARPTSPASLHQTGSADDDAIGDESATTGHTVEVTYEGRTAEIVVRPDESILSALERTGAADELSISTFPQDCRRGNCLTCTGKLVGGEGSSASSAAVSSLRRGDDGLAPLLSEEVRRKGYVLTCSSYVVGDGLKIELGRNAEAWEDIYKSRYECDEAERLGQEARAKVLRISAERNLPKWTKETEQVLEKSG